MASPGYATTWAQLAKAVGYPNWSSVNLHYGKFAERVARHLGLTDKPLDPGGTRWWLWALVRWFEDRDPESGHTVFVLRRPAVEAMEWLGVVPLAGFASPDEVRAAGSLVEGAVCRVTVNAYERNPEAHQPRCYPCGFDFGAAYGPEFTGFIHVHHLRPLSEVGGEYAVDPVEDLRPVCPNCHAVIHHGGRLRSIEEVRQLLVQQRQVAPGTTEDFGRSES